MKMIVSWKKARWTRDVLFLNMRGLGVIVNRSSRTSIISFLYDFICRHHIIVVVVIVLLPLVEKRIIMMSWLRIRIVTATLAPACP